MVLVADALGHKGSSHASPTAYLKCCSCSDDGCHGPTCVERRKGKKVFPKASKCELVDYNSLPAYLKDNQFVLCYYRAEWPLKQTILSIFSLHNETLNIWTHLVGFFIFLALMTCAAMVMHRSCHAETALPTGSNSHFLPPGVPPAPPPPIPASSNVTSQRSSTPSCPIPQFLPCHCLHGVPPCNPSAGLSPSNHTVAGGETNATPLVTVPPAPRWPFFTYLGGAMACLLVSAACHLLSCHSQRFLYVMRWLDYVGITVLIVTSFYPVVYYSFMCRRAYMNLYLGLITASGLAMVCVSLVPAFHGPRHRLLRAGLFFCMGLSGAVPILHKAVAFRDRPAALVTTGYEAVMGVLYVAATAVYSFRVPERWRPGRFDLVGQSHQLFHVVVVAAAYTHYLGGVVYLRWRDSEGC